MTGGYQHRKGRAEVVEAEPGAEASVRLAGFHSHTQIQSIFYRQLDFQPSASDILSASLQVRFGKSSSTTDLLECPLPCQSSLNA